MGTASRQGDGTNLADAAAYFVSETGRTAAAVVDMIGHSRLAPVWAERCATTAAIVGAQDGQHAGLLAAATLVRDVGRGPEPVPNGVAVLAVTGEEYMQITWLGDCVAYSWDGVRLRLMTTPETVGEFLRYNEEADDDGRPVRHANWVLQTMRRLTPYYIAMAEVPVGHTLILGSDGVADQVDHAVLEELAREHHARPEPDPQALAEAIVAAAERRGQRDLDDVTALVMIPA
ncbi:SpoIIE family protein phosphatase [Streptomyces sp. CAU 1734]|uniref:SpoIIE family protein phosphatase n=1 Tax=Streptomyces sp. CAU 1734 TaxID=3140360 RepID=UPI0032619AD1